MAKKIAGPQMIVANRLDDGRAVFLAPDGSWTKVAADAATASDNTGIETLSQIAAAAEAANQVVSVTLVEANTEDTVSPAHIKFAMQAKGPSVRPDLGYQVSPSWET